MRHSRDLKIYWSGFLDEYIQFCSGNWMKIDWEESRRLRFIFAVYETITHTQVQQVSFCDIATFPV